MKVALTGSTGLIGRALVRALQGRGDEAIGASRGAEGPLRWDPASGFSPPDALSGFDAVVHLAGENIAGKRWSEAQKRRIRDSRIEGTRVVVDALEAASPRPRVLVSGAAVGYYGNRGDELLEESSGAGSGFLAELCVEWEAAAARARELGVRLVIVRTGLVMSKEGGPLAKMLPAFKLGGGGRLGDGRQWMPWIHADDLTRVLLRTLDDEAMSGTFNAVAPGAVTNAEFTKTLGKVIRRPTFMAMPAFALRTIFGELASALLEGQRAAPAALEQLGFEFDHPELQPALEHLLG